MEAIAMREPHAGYYQYGSIDEFGASTDATTTANPVTMVYRCLPVEMEPVISPPTHADIYMEPRLVEDDVKFRRGAMSNHCWKSVERSTASLLSHSHSSFQLPISQ